MYRDRYVGLILMISALHLWLLPGQAEAQNEAVQQNIDTLIKTNSCVGCDLRGADLNRMILTGADLSNADLRKASLLLADLSGAKLNNANLREAKFGGADLANADLRGADLRGAVLDGAYLIGSLLDEETIESARDNPDLEAKESKKAALPKEPELEEVKDQKKIAVDAELAPAQNSASPEVLAPPVKKPSPVGEATYEADANEVPAPPKYF